MNMYRIMLSVFTVKRTVRLPRRQEAVSKWIWWQSSRQAMRWYQCQVVEPQVWTVV